MDNVVLPTVLGIFCCYSNSIFSPSRTDPEIAIGRLDQDRSRTSSSRTLDRTYEFQTGRRAVKAVSALASVKLAITGILSDPRRH